MDHDNPQFAAAVKKILAKELLDRLDSIHELFQDLKNSVTEAINAHNQRQQSPPVLRAELKIPHAEPYEYKSKPTFELFRESLELWLEVFGILVVITYTTLTALQLREMIKATNAAKDAVVEAQLSRQQAEKSFKATVDQFHMDERAWVGVDSLESPGASIDDARIEIRSITVTIHNSGKTPALKASINCCIPILRKWGDSIPEYDQVVNDAAADTAKFDKMEREAIADITKNHPPNGNDILRKIREGRSNDSQRVKMFTANDHVRTGIALPPSGSPYKIELNEADSEPASITTERQVHPGITEHHHEAFILYLLGKITYNDVFHGSKQHATKFCYMTSMRKLVACPEGNWMD